MTRFAATRTLAMRRPLQRSRATTNFASRAPRAAGRCPVRTNEYGARWRRATKRPPSLNSTARARWEKTRIRTPCRTALTSTSSDAA